MDSVLIQQNVEIAQGRIRVRTYAWFPQHVRTTYVGSSFTSESTLAPPRDGAVTTPM